MNTFAPAVTIDPAAAVARTRPRATLREAGIATTALSVSKPTLDEVFLALTGRETDSTGTEEEAA